MNMRRTNDINAVLAFVKQHRAWAEQMRNTERDDEAWESYSGQVIAYEEVEQEIERLLRAHHHRVVEPKDTPNEAP
jgi:hypothetical protein